MKTTSCLLIALLVAVLNLGRPTPARAGFPIQSHLQMATTIVVSQRASDETDEKARRKKADGLVRLARRAMADGNLEIAESLIERAEKLNVHYGILHLGDRPDKVRRDLERQREIAKSPERPKERFSLPFTSSGSSGSSDGKPPAKDPFQVDHVTSGQLTLKDDKRAAIRFLTMGRKQLLEGNLAGAANLYEQAAAMQVEFGPEEDSPQKLLNDIRQAGGHAKEYVNPAQRPTGAPKGALFGPPGPAGLGSPADINRTQAAESANPFELGDEGPLPTLGRDEMFRVPAGESPGSTPSPSPFHVTMDPPTEFRVAPAAAQDVLPRGDQVTTPVQTPQSAGASIDENSPFDGSDLGDADPFADAASKKAAAALTARARNAMAAGDFGEAQRLAGQALTIKLPEDAFAPGEDSPQHVLADLASAATTSNALERANRAGAAGDKSGEANALYQQSGDRTANVLSGAQTDAEPRILLDPSLDQAATPVESQNNGRPTSPDPQAIELQPIPEAARMSQRPDAPEPLPNMPPLRGETGDGYEADLTAEPNAVPPDAPQGESILENTARTQEVLAKKLLADVNRSMSEARRLQESDPKQSLSILQTARQKVATSGLDPAPRDQLLRRLDSEIKKADRFLTENRDLMELEERNAATLSEIEHEQAVKVEVQERVARLVDDFNKLMDQKRFPEAEIVAKRAAELMPKEPVVMQLQNQVKFTRRYINNQDIADRKEHGFHDELDAVVESSIPQDDRDPLVFPKLEDWNDLSNRRRSLNPPERIQRSEKEIEILQRLRTPVLLQYENAPLEEVLGMLADYAKVNLHIDKEGLAEDGVTPTVPVSIDLSTEIMLKSALNLILEPLHLSYVIRDEVLMITSEHRREGELKRVTYYVADLVTPIPNFVPSNRMGLASSLQDAYAMIGYNSPPGFGARQAPIGVLATDEPELPESPLNENVLAQPGAGLSPAGGANPMAGFGPGGAGGGAAADFDSLIELITTTVAPTTWDEVGGSGAIQEFRTNLSLVISQTEEVHDEIVDLLEQLRRLQDLQVTIEVRFITLNDSFFERIGVDFDFDIDDDSDKPFQVFGQPDPNFQPAFDNSGALPGRDVQDRDHGPSTTVGLQAPGVFSADLDIPFRQGNFDLAVPQFGGFDPTAGAQLGFAILSDLEAFFFINAAQADRRSNVLQAPKVTLFNGQAAFVADTSQSPFVISVIPVVGDFAAAQQPVIVVLSQGTMLTVQATVSSDRRFVRLTLVPFFSTIGDVNTFTFNGSTETNMDTSESGPDDARDMTNISRTVTSGTTVQLPTFAFITVATTVSVPDGGSVLLGGIKRLSEGRTEAGVPFLNKLPYVSRLFKNVGIGRETTSLMMMVTPRIIIQEEEEALLGAISGS